MKIFWGLYPIVIEVFVSISIIPQASFLCKFKGHFYHWGAFREKSPVQCWWRRPFMTQNAYHTILQHEALPALTFYDDICKHDRNNQITFREAFNRKTFFCDSDESFFVIWNPLVSHLSQKIFSIKASLKKWCVLHRRTSSTALMFIHTNLNLKILDRGK